MRSRQIAGDGMRREHRRYGGKYGRLCFIFVSAVLILLLASCNIGKHKSPNGSESFSESGNTEGTGNGSEGQSTPHWDGNIPEPDSEAGDALIISKVYAPGGNPDAPMNCGYIEIYNLLDRDILLDGVSLYYGEGKSFSRFDFIGVTIGGGEYLLIKCASCDGYDSNYEIMRVEQYDLEWNINPDNKEFELVLGRTGADITPGGEFEGEDIYSYVRASIVPDVDIYTVDDLTKNKVIVRTCLEKESGYHLVNLTKSGSAELEKITPKTSAGDVNTYINSDFTEVKFSRSGGVYGDAFSLTLSAPDGYQIYYTTDGSDPRTNGIRYEGGIQIKDTNSMPWGDVINTAIDLFGGSMVPSENRLFGGTVIKACAKKDGDVSAVYTNTYFVSETLADAQVAVMSMSLDIDDFLGPENGAYYTFQYDLWATRPRSRAFLEYFSEDGEKRGGSYIEFAVSGNGSSGYAMKSLRLYYKNPLDANDPAPDSLEYDVFDGWAANSEGQKITTFERILIRNAGNDFGVSYLRDVFCQRMAYGLYVDSMAYKPVFLFVNGEFWGMYNLRERYSPEYFSQRYGVLEENVAIIENESPLKYNSSPQSWNNDYVSTAGDPAQADIFNDLVAYIKSHDLSDPEVYGYVSDRIDVDSFIDYWIFNSYFCNMDWPGNNIKVWRNTDPDDPSGMDTKWRFVLLDLDHCLGYAGTNDYTTSMFDRINDSTRCGAVMNGFMKNEEFRRKFAQRAYELVTEYLAPEYSVKVLEDMADKVDGLIDYQFARYQSGGNRWSWESEIEYMKEFLRNRPDYYLAQVYSYTGYDESDLAAGADKKLSLSFDESIVSVTVNGEIVKNGQTIETGKENGTVKIEATPVAGYTAAKIVYADSTGNIVSADGACAEFDVKASGDIAVHVKKSNPEKVLDVSVGIDAGMYSVFYVDSGGDLYAWGDNTGSALGAGLGAAHLTKPTFVMGNVSKAATSRGIDAAQPNNFSTAVLTVEGELYTVGDNSYGQLGRTGEENVLLKVDFDGVITDVALGLDHMLVLDADGVLWGVGNNSYGQLGERNYGGTASSFQKLAENVAKIAAGRRSTFYTDYDGNLYALGDNRWNKVHTGSVGDMVTPYLVTEDVRNVFGGEHQALILKNDGTLYYVGWRRFDSFEQTESQPDCPNGVLYKVCENVTDAEIQDSHIVALLEDGSVFGYGLNTYGQIKPGGQGSVVGSAEKITDGAVSVAAGSGFTAVLKRDGGIVTFGSNNAGQAGNGQMSQNADGATAIFD